MNLLTLWELCCLVVLCSIAIGQALMCVQCNSHEDKVAGDCEYNARSPTTCFGDKEVKQYCNTIREIDMAGTQIGFVRSCTPTKHDGHEEEEYCKVLSENPEPAGTAKLCYLTCDYDGCNHATRLPANSFLAIGLSVLSLFAALKS